MVCDITHDAVVITPPLAPVIKFYPNFLPQSYVLEIILTLESAVDYVEDDELQPSNVNPVTPHKYSDMRPLSSSSIIPTHSSCKADTSVV